MTNIKITLTSEQYEELEKLEKGQRLELDYHGIRCWIEAVDANDDLAFFNAIYKGRNYLFEFCCPPTVEISVKSEPKQ